jgi:hypothetical protein
MNYFVLNVTILMQCAQIKFQLKENACVESFKVWIKLDLLCRLPLGLVCDPRANILQSGCRRPFQPR